MSYQSLVRQLASITDVRLMHAFLEDLLSEKEIQDVEMRWKLVQLLHDGVSQRDISEKLGVGIATVTRGSKMLQKKDGGFRNVLSS